MKSKDQITEYHLHRERPSKRQFEIYDLSKYWQKNRVHAQEPHSHSFYQIIWFFDGQGQHYVDFESFDIQSNTLFFISPNQVHYFEDRTDYSGILIHFNEVFLYQNEEDIDIFLRYNVFNNFRQPFLPISKGLVEELKKFVDLMLLELGEESSFGHQSILSNILKSFLFFAIIERVMIWGCINNPTETKPTVIIIDNDQISRGPGVKRTLFSLCKDCSTRSIKDKS